MRFLKNTNRVLSILTSMSISMFLTSPGALAENTNPAAELKENSIVHLGVVVKNIEKSTKRLSEIFGVPSWTYIDLTPDMFENIVLHDQQLGNKAKTHLKIANGNIMGFQFELMQPVSGQGTHVEFLKKHGEGLHHISIDPLSPAEHDKIVSGLQNVGIGIEMQGTLGKATTFTYMDTQEELGLLFEIF